MGKKEIQMKKREVEFTVIINKDKSETYSGNIINGYKEGIGKLVSWSGREEIGEFKDNEKNGYFEEYFNGVKKFEGYYRDNKKHGLSKEYLRNIDTDSEERNEGSYINGEKEGIWKEFVNGKLFKEENYSKGKKHGRCTTYYEENNTSLMRKTRENCEYREGNVHEGFIDYGDCETFFVDYSELTQEEKEKLIEDLLESYYIGLDSDTLEELYNVIGTTTLESEHIEWIIGKFIESNYDEESVFGKVVYHVFNEDNKIEVERFEKNIEVYEYANGRLIHHTRFDEFKSDFIDKELFKNIVCNVKDIYFRKNNIIEFINKFVELESKNMFSSIKGFMKIWLSVQMYTSAINNNIFYERSILYNYIKVYNPKAKGKIIGIKYSRNIDKKLLSYFKIIDSKYCFNSEEEAVLTAWLLLYYKSIEYLSNVFFLKYKNEYNDIIDLDLYSCINKYLLIVHDLDDEVEKMMFVCFLIDRRKINIGYKPLNIIEFNIFDAYEKVCELLIKEKEQKELLDFERYVMQGEKEKSKRIDISIIDHMSGYEFEELICNLFKKQGFKTLLTKKTNDQGVDIIAERGNTRIGIQTKRYSKKVNNSAIQEVTTGLNYYNLNKGIVITNNYFTKSAIELAKANAILLWDRDKLIEKIDEIDFLF